MGVVARAIHTHRQNEARRSYAHHDSGDRFGTIYSSCTGWMREVSRAQQITDRRCTIRSRWKCRVFHSETDEPNRNGMALPWVVGAVKVST